MLMEGMGATSPSNDYAYNGKELNEDFGLNLSDYGARWYDAALGRWGAVDPLAEKYTPWSGYNYVMNNPAGLVDPDGMRVTDPLYYSSSQYMADEAERGKERSEQQKKEYEQQEAKKSEEEWKPFYQSTLKSYAKSIGHFNQTNQGIGELFEMLFRDYVTNNGTFDHSTNTLVDSRTIQRNMRVFSNSGRGSMPDFIGAGLYTSFKIGGMRQISVRGAAWYELKAWRFSSTITLDNPVTGSELYQTRNHINNLSSEFRGNSNTPFTYLLYVTPSGVNIEEAVYQYAISQRVAVIHLITEYKIENGQYHIRFVHKPVTGK